MDSRSPQAPVKRGAIALDLETLRRATDWSEADKRSMGISVCCVEWIESGATHTLTGDDRAPFSPVTDLAQAFTDAPRIVTFGGGDDTESGFDFAVLEGAGIAVPRQKGFDIRLAIKQATGGKLPKGLTLGKLAQANLGRGKSGKGEDAPEAWARGEYQAVADYCADDTRLTADLYRLWRDQGYLVLPADGGGGRIVGSPDGDLKWEQNGKTETSETHSRATVDGDSGSGGNRDRRRLSATVSAGTGHVSGQGVGGGEAVSSQPEPAQSVAVADKSVSPITQTDLADKSVEPADKSAGKVIDFSSFKSRRLTSQSVADFDKKHWKRSRLKPGWLIRRLTGYNIVENEYGVQYLGVVSRKPDRMSADSLEYPLAGFFIWSVMAEQSLLVEERGEHARAKLG